jgi:hypothetical protein
VSIPAHVVSGLAAEGIDVSAQTPQSLTAELAAGASQVISFGCDLPPVSHVGLTHWDDVPAVSDGFQVARDAIFKRVQELLATIAAPERSDLPS